MVHVRPGEGRKIVLTFLYFFLLIAAYYVVKPVSRSLILGSLGFRMVPAADLICVLLMGPVLAGCARLVDWIKKPQLVTCAFWVMIGVFLGFWVLLRRSSGWIAGAFYVWVALFSVLAVTLFWLVANDLYRPQDVKRLFGFIGSAGILGGIVGSALAAGGAQLLGTPHLLLMAAVLLVCSWLVVCRLWSYALAPLTSSHPTEASAQDSTVQAAAAYRAAPNDRSAAPSTARGITKALFQSRYLLLLVALVGLSKIVSTLVSYQVNPFLEQAFPNQDVRTTFTSLFFGGMNIASFVVQFFFTSWVLRRLGLSVALCMLPLGLLGGIAGWSFLPSCWFAVAAELYDGSLNYSLQQTVKEMLYVPIDRSIRHDMKLFIDTTVFRCGKAIAALIGILMLGVLHAPSLWLNDVVLPLVVAWLVVALWLQRDYATVVRTSLQARATSRRAVSSSDARTAMGAVSRERDGARSFGCASAESGRALHHADGKEEATPFGALIDGQPSVRKLELMGRFLKGVTGIPSTVKDLLEALNVYELRAIPPTELAGGSSWLRRIIGDRQASLAKRRHAIRLLGRLSNQETVDYLFGLVMAEEDVGLRHEVVRSLVKLRVSGRRLGFPTSLIHRQISYEAANYRRLALVEAVCRQHHRRTVTASTNDPVMALLKTLMEESIEQTFRLLMLLYRPADIHLVYEQMRSSDRDLQADALELLDNFMDPTVRAMLFPILGEDRFLEGLNESALPECEPTMAYRLLQEAIWDHNYWLSVATLCAIGRWQLSALRPEVERALRHPIPAIATAAKIALHLSAKDVRATVRTPQVTR